MLLEVPASPAGRGVVIGIKLAEFRKFFMLESHFESMLVISQKLIHGLAGVEKAFVLSVFTRHDKEAYPQQPKPQPASGDQNSQHVFQDSASHHVIRSSFFRVYSFEHFCQPLCLSYEGKVTGGTRYLGRLNRRDKAISGAGDSPGH